MATPKKKTKTKPSNNVRPERFGGSSDEWIVTRPGTKPKPNP